MVVGGAGVVFCGAFFMIDVLGRIFGVCGGAGAFFIIDVFGRIFGVCGGVAGS